MPPLPFCLRQTSLRLEGAAHVGQALSRQFRLAYGESPYGYPMTRRIERAMALLRRGDLSVTEVCFAVGCSSLGTFSSGFADLVGMPPSTYRRHQARATAGCSRAWRNR
jgi:transcriptional regulator GlxA family with amidase domain